MDGLCNPDPLGRKRMSSTPRFRVIGTVVGVALLALAAGFFLLSRGQPSSSAASTHTVVPLSKRAKTPVKKHAVKKHPIKKAAARKPAARKPAQTVNGMPAALAAALSRNKIVVVSLYAPDVALDEMATREARAGAAAAGVGFVAFDVMNEGQSKALTKMLGILEDPAVLVFRRPGDVVIRFSGFADMQTVQQAARNAGL
jgi:thiol:disulfide interchange protein